MDTAPPPFTMTNPKTANDFFAVGVHEDNLQHYDNAIAAYLIHGKLPAAGKRCKG